MKPARGAFDARWNIQAESEERVWEIALAFLEEIRRVAPPGVDVRYVQLRPPRRSPSWLATMRPGRKQAA